MSNNRYLIHGICEDLREGKRVGVLAPFLSESQMIFRSVIEELDYAEVVSRRLTHGAERLAHVNAPGTLYMLRHGGEAEERRGMRLDVLVITDWSSITEAGRSHLELTLGRTELVKF